MDDTKNTKLIPTRKIFFALFGLAVKLRPQLLLVTLGSSILKSGNVLLTIWIPKIILDGFDKNWPLAKFIQVLIVLAVIKLLANYFEDLAFQLNNHEQNLFTNKVDLHFSQKITKVKYEILEDPDALDLKQRALAPIEYGYLHWIFENLQEILSAIITIVGIITILLNFSLGLFLIVTLISVVAFLIEGKLSSLAIKFQQELVPINRRYNYYVGILNDEIHQKEHRLYNLSDIVTEKLLGYNKEIMSKLREMNIKVGNAQTISTFINIFSRLILYSYAGLRVLGIMGAKTGLGDFSILVGANENYGNSLKVLGKNSIEMVNVINAIEPVIAFLELEEMDEQGQDEAKKHKSSKKKEAKIKTIKPGRLKQLTFENVTFTYPKTDRKILDNVSFTLNEGEALAIVGRNNAGKSTIVKLICRLFEPDSGRILWNGVDIRDFSYSDYLDEIACVFQDFKLFPLRIWENVASTWTDASIDTNENTLPLDIKHKLDKVIEKVELTQAIEKLPSGLNTWLEKSLNEDATDFSGGQKQKLAIARAIYKDASVAILDEPTAALDPLAESEVYGHFADLIKGKTAIFISHRMSASRFCDRIIVLEGGKITGNGHHTKLINQNDLYRSLYEAQAKYYE
jgi:ATP-binding cassette subfamily B protein